MSTPTWWYEGKKYLASQDPVLKKIFTQFDDTYTILKSGDPFSALVGSIISQQISTKAADAIEARFVALVKQVDPKHIKKYSVEELRSVGLSNQKASYIHNIADYFVDNEIQDSFWFQDYESVIHPGLLSIKGVGNWTIQMLAIFYLHQPDILPITDLGIINGTAKNYPKFFAKLDKKHSSYMRLAGKQVEQIAKKWKPYSSIGSWYMWKTLDNETKKIPKPKSIKLKKNG